MRCTSRDQIWARCNTAAYNLFAILWNNSSRLIRSKSGIFLMIAGKETHSVFSNDLSFYLWTYSFRLHMLRVLRSTEVGTNARHHVHRNLSDRHLQLTSSFANHSFIRISTVTSSLLSFSGLIHRLTPMSRPMRFPYSSSGFRFLSMYLPISKLTVKANFLPWKSKKRC